MTKNEIRKVTISLTAEEQKTLSSASAIMAQLFDHMSTDEETYTLYCEVDIDCFIDYDIDKLGKIVDALYTIANHPLEIE